MGMRTAIVVGATGLIGASLVKQLCENEAYISVTVLARKKPDFEHPKLEVKVRSFDRLEENDIDFAHELYCCLGTTIKKAGTKEAFEQVDFEYPLYIASLAKKRGIPHMLVITAMGANEKSPFYYNRVKGKLEHALKDLKLQRLSIIRPSLLVGDREEFRFGEKAGALVLKILKPFLIGPLKQNRAIHASQVAKAMIVIALHGKKQPVTIYPSQELARLDFPKAKESDTDNGLSKWDQRAVKETEKIDREVVINRDKFKIDDTVVDHDVQFTKRNKENE